METKANYVAVGIFTVLAVLAAFGFVYWTAAVGDRGETAVLRVRIPGSASGLGRGSAVLFNGIKVGEVVSLGLTPDNPRGVSATVAVAQNTPIRRDTKVGLEFQGLTGVPVVALEGGQETASSGPVEMLVAEPGANQSMTGAARDALRRVDQVLEENSGPLRSTIANLQTFSEGLAKNTPRLDGIIAGVERMTGAAPTPKKVMFDLQAATRFAEPRKPLRGPLVISEPSGVVMYDTQRFLFEPGKELAGFTDAQWSDSVPKLLQSKLLQSFENYDIAHPPLRDGDETAPRLAADIRSFQIKGDAEMKAELSLSVKLIGKNGQVAAARVFTAEHKLDGNDPAAAVAAFNAAFGTLMTELAPWVASAL